MANYVYICTFLMLLPVFWYILNALNFEHLFKQGKITLIRAGFVLFTIIGAHLVAYAMYIFTNCLVNLLG